MWTSTCRGTKLAWLRRDRVSNHNNGNKRVWMAIRTTIVAALLHSRRRHVGSAHRYVHSAAAWAAVLAGSTRWRVLDTSCRMRLLRRSCTHCFQAPARSGCNRVNELGRKHGADVAHKCASVSSGCCLEIPRHRALASGSCTCSTMRHTVAWDHSIRRAQVL